MAKSNNNKDGNKISSKKIKKTTSPPKSIQTTKLSSKTSTTVTTASASRSTPRSKSPSRPRSTSAIASSTAKHRSKNQSSTDGASSPSKRRSKHPSSTDDRKPAAKRPSTTSTKLKARSPKSQPGTPDTAVSGSTASSKASPSSEVRKIMVKKLNFNDDAATKRTQVNKKTKSAPIKKTGMIYKTHQIDWFTVQGVNAAMLQIDPEVEANEMSYTDKAEIVLHSFSPKELMALYYMLSAKCGVDLNDTDPSDFSTKAKACKLIMEALVKYRNATVDLEDTDDEYITNIVVKKEGKQKRGS